MLTIKGTYSGGVTVNIDQAKCKHNQVPHGPRLYCVYCWYVSVVSAEVSKSSAQQ